MAMKAPTSEGLGQMMEVAIRRHIFLTAGYEATSKAGEPITMRHLPSGTEFMLECRALPMASDG